MGWILFALGGWAAVVPMGVFFSSSSVLSHMFPDRRQSTDILFEKSSVRDAGQVVANGGIATVLVVLWWLTGDHRWYAGFLGSTAAANADTWATELGTLSRHPPRLITSFQRVEPGRSGAVSPLGLLSAAGGSALVVASSLPWVPPRVLLPAGVAGLAGSLADSILGATVQAQFQCRICGKTTESTSHCGCESDHVRGFRTIRNDLVNWGCTLVGGSIALFALR